MSGLPTDPKDAYDSDATVLLTPSPPHATPECYLHESTNSSNQRIYTYHPATSTHIIHNHNLLPRPTSHKPLLPIIHPPIAQTNPAPHHANEAWPGEVFVHPATDFACHPDGGGADDKKRVVDYEIPIEMFYGREYRQMQRWIGEAQVRNGNEGVRWNWLPVEMDERGSHHGPEKACLGVTGEDGSTAAAGIFRTGDGTPADVSCAVVGRIKVEELGAAAQVMKRKAEELLDSVEGRRRVGRPGKKPKAEERQSNERDGNAKAVVLWSPNDGLFGDGENEDQVDEEELYKRCMAILGE